MSIYADTQTPSHFARAVNAVAGIVVARARESSSCSKTAATPSILAGLDDHMLADIGLTRGDRSRCLSPSRYGAIRPQFW